MSMCARVHTARAVLQEPLQQLNLHLLFSSLELTAGTPPEFTATPDDSEQTRCLEAQPAFSTPGRI